MSQLMTVENQAQPQAGEIAVVDSKAWMLEVSQVKRQIGMIHNLMKQVMGDGKHYGTIPGTQKPTLLKPGGELLAMMFRLDPQYEIETKWQDNHLTIISRCILFHMGTGQRIASGMGMCSTMESKYAYRNAGRICPKCKTEAIYKSKEEYGGGFYCNKKAKGCGASFSGNSEEAAAIAAQPVGKVPNDDLADMYNTVLKMANKRSFIAAILNATAASEVFTQDVEDMEDNAHSAGNPNSQPKMTTAPTAPTPATVKPAAKPAAAPQVKPKPSAVMDTRDGTFRVKSVEAYKSESGVQAWKLNIYDHDGEFMVKTNLEPFRKLAQMAAEQFLEVFIKYDVYSTGNVVRDIQVSGLAPADDQPALGF